MTRQAWWGRVGLGLAGRSMARLGAAVVAQDGRIDGQPQDDRWHNLGGREVPPRHQRPSVGGDNWSPTAGGGGSNKSGGCAVTAVALAAGPWLADLLLAGSAVTW